MGPESKLRDKCRKELQRRIKEGEKIFFFKSVGGRFQSAGIPDFVLSVRGRFVGIELKVDSKVTLLQESVGKQIAAADGVWAVCRSVDELRIVIDAI